MKKIISTSKEETIFLASQLAKHFEKGMVLLLEGDLGIGKTTFTKGFGQGLGITRNISSPTFTIVKVYKGNIPLYHIDAYRLEDASEDIGLEDLIFGDAITVIEWPGYISDYLPEEYLEISFKYLDEDSRILEFKASGERYQKMLEVYYESIGA